MKVHSVHIQNRVRSQAGTPPYARCRSLLRWGTHRRGGILPALLPGVVLRERAPRTRTRVGGQVGAARRRVFVLGPPRGRLVRGDGAVGRLHLRCGGRGRAAVVVLRGRGVRVWIRRRGVRVRIRRRGVHVRRGVVHLRRGVRLEGRGCARVLRVAAERLRLRLGREGLRGRRRGHARGCVVARARVARHARRVRVRRGRLGVRGREVAVDAKLGGGLVLRLGVRVGGRVGHPRACVVVVREQRGLDGATAACCPWRETAVTVMRSHGTVPCLRILILILGQGTG